MEKVINVERREKTTSNANARLRKNGFLPGVVYGKKVDAFSVSVKKDELRKAVSNFGMNTVFKLKTPENDTFDVIVKEIQSSSIGSEMLHVDFQQISLTEAIETEVPIRIIGLDLLERKRLILNRNLDSIHIKCLPQDIPEAIDIDVSEFEEGASFTVADVKLDPKLTLVSDESQVVFTISQPEVLEALDDSAEASEEVVEPTVEEVVNE